MVQFCCIPAPAGVQGNDRIDLITKGAVKKNIVDPLGRGVVKTLIKKDWVGLLAETMGFE